MSGLSKLPTLGLLLRKVNCVFGVFCDEPLAMRLGNGLLDANIPMVWVQTGAQERERFRQRWFETPQTDEQKWQWVIVCDGSVPEEEWRALRNNATVLVIDKGQVESFLRQSSSMPEPHYQDYVTWLVEGVLKLVLEPAPAE